MRVSDGDRLQFPSIIESDGTATSMLGVMPKSLLDVLPTSTPVDFVVTFHSAVSMTRLKPPSVQFVYHTFVFSGKAGTHVCRDVSGRLCHGVACDSCRSAAEQIAREESITADVMAGVFDVKGVVDMSAVGTGQQAIVNSVDTIPISLVRSMLSPPHPRHIA